MPKSSKKSGSKEERSKEEPVKRFREKHCKKDAEEIIEKEVVSSKKHKVLNSCALEKKKHELKIQKKIVKKQQICACLAAQPVEINDTGLDPVVVDDNKVNEVECAWFIQKTPLNGVLAYGRCLFRAIAHMVCLRNGEGAPDENQQKELANKLRAQGVQVVDELLKFIEENFDVYIKRIEKPYVWGGESELLMASHVLKTMIPVFMLEGSTQKLLNIATYGKEYEKDDKSSIKVLFYGYLYIRLMSTFHSTGQGHDCNDNRAFEGIFRNRDLNWVIDADMFIGFEDIEVDDDMREELPRPFCT
ncbi:hypothetical protein M8C21_021459, partial [Ambrosia artemisiifolia]